MSRSYDFVDIPITLQVLLRLAERKLHKKVIENENKSR